MAELLSEALRGPMSDENVLALIDRLAEEVKLFRLGCNMEPEAARLAYESMKG